MSIRYSIVVPVFNEELVIEESYRRLHDVMEQTGEDYELIFVNDGSRDKTEELVSALCDKDPHVRLLSFSRNSAVDLLFSLLIHPRMVVGILSSVTESISDGAISS